MRSAGRSAPFSAGQSAAQHADTRGAIYDAACAFQVLEHVADPLGLDPHAADIVIVKIGYLEPELYDAAADWLLALTPGSVDQDLLRLGHHTLGGPVFPFDTSVTEPDLTPWVR